IGVAFFLLVKVGPLRELVMKSLDQIQNKGNKLGTMSPMDQVLWRTHLLEASLMGFTLFLGFLIERMHHYLRKLINIRSKVGASKEELEKIEKEKQQLKEKEEKASKEITTLQNELSKLTEEIKKLKVESQEKDKTIETADAHVVALQKQAADLLLEYDRLLEDNQNLQTQVQKR
uniref:Endoplasmic reticulum transmembrane protein n=1 Tax=Chenopodium quinoa TaxID=63459 RepID=A0A803LNM7_CHEQI